MAKMGAEGSSDRLMWKMRSRITWKPRTLEYHAVAASISLTEIATWLIGRA